MICRWAGTATITTGPSVATSHASEKHYWWRPMLHCLLSVHSARVYDRGVEISDTRIEPCVAMVRRHAGCPYLIQHVHSTSTASITHAGMRRRGLMYKQSANDVCVSLSVTSTEEPSHRRIAYPAVRVTIVPAANAPADLSICMQ